MLALGAIGLVVAVIQHGAWATMPGLPDLSLALLAWAVVDGDEDHLPHRALLLGVVNDLTDPGSTGFHTVTAALVALAAIFARQVLFRARLAAWFLGGTLIWLFVAVADLPMSGLGDHAGWRALIEALGTGAAAAAFGWLLGGLPTRWRPIAPAGA